MHFQTVTNDDEVELTLTGGAVFPAPECEIPTAHRGRALSARAAGRWIRAAAKLPFIVADGVPAARLPPSAIRLTRQHFQPSDGRTLNWRFNCDAESEGVLVAQERLLARSFTDQMQKFSETTLPRKEK